MATGDLFSLDGRLLGTFIIKSFDNHCKPLVALMFNLFLLEN